MKLYAASFSTILWRFYAMMAIGIVAILTGVYALGVLCLPLLIMCLLGISFKSDVAAAHVKTNTHVSTQMPMNREAA